MSDQRTVPDIKAGCKKNGNGCWAQNSMKTSSKNGIAKLGFGQQLETPEVRKRLLGSVIVRSRKDCANLRASPEIVSPGCSPITGRRAPTSGNDYESSVIIPSNLQIPTLGSCRNERHAHHRLHFRPTRSLATIPPSEGTELLSPVVVLPEEGKHLYFFDPDEESIVESMSSTRVTREFSRSFVLL